MNWVELNVEGPVATVVLGAASGPSRINVESAREWLEALERIEDDDSVKVVVTRAEGPVWSAGGDLAEFEARADQAHDFVLEIGKWINPVIRNLHESSKLTVASVHGAVAGGGLGPMLASDFVIASEETAFTLGYSKLATNPDAGVSWFLPRLVGYRKALELYLTSERLTAEQARELGMINQIAAKDKLAEETAQWVERFSDLSSHAVASTKRLLRDSEAARLEAHLHDEIRAFAVNTTRDDFPEGVNAFLERRDPRFSA